MAIAFSGAEDVVLIEYARRTGKPFRVFALDTARLHPETYRFFAEVEKYFKLKIEYVFPKSEEVESLVNEKGLFSFFEDGHKVRRSISGMDADKLLFRSRIYCWRRLPSFFPHIGVLWD